MSLVRAADVPAAKNAPRPDLLPAIELAPFVVKGEKISISILARSRGDKSYAEKFAEDVIQVADAALEKSPGAGLVIIGDKGEPHPVFLFRKFVAMAEAGQLDPAVAARATEASKLMREWQQRLMLDDAAKQGMPLETFLKALPLPLEGVASKLYQWAWAEGFDDKRVEQKFRSLTLADFGRDQLARFDWVFYLPPREAAGEVIKEMVPVMLKKEKVGLLKRAALRSAMVVFAPAIRKAVESARKGMLFMTLLRARSSYSQEEIQQLTRAYVRVMMPDFKFNDGNTRERAIQAVEAQKIANAEYAKDPFVSPTRVAEFDLEAFAAFEGSYAEKDAPAQHRFVRTADGVAWQFLAHKPRPYFPAGDRLFVSENGKNTLRFLVDETGAVTGVEERAHRHRKTFQRATLPPVDPERPETTTRKR